MSCFKRVFFFAAVFCLFAMGAQGALIHGLLASGQSLSTGCQGYASGQVVNTTQPYSNTSLSPGTTVLEGPGGATVSPIVQSSGAVPASPTIANGGSGYTSAPTVYVVGDGTGGTYTANLTGGAVTSLTRTSAGSGYTHIYIFMTFPVQATSVLQLDTAPLIPLVAPWTCNNSTGDSTDPSNLGQEYPSLSAANQLTYLTGGVSGNQYVLGLHGSSGRDYMTIGGPTDVYTQPNVQCGTAAFAPSQPSPNPSFANGLAQALAMKNAVTGGGNTFRMDAVILTHGENDEIEYNHCYDVNLATLQKDYETQVNATIGASGKIPLFTDQQQAWGFYHGSGTVPVAAIAQWRAAEDNPGKVYLVGPIYYLPTGALNDGVHKSPAGYRTMGELTGKVIDWVVNQGKQWVPVMPKTITISGATITAKFFVPVGSLTLDTTTVAAQTNSGFEFTDGRTAQVQRIYQDSGAGPLNPVIYDPGAGYGSAPTVTVSGACGALPGYTANISGGKVVGLTQTSAGSTCTVIDILFSAPTPSVSISSVSVSASDTVTVTLSGTPTGPTPTLRYAYTAPSAVGGGLGNLRDNDTTAGRTGSNLSDWCVTFSAAIPFRSNLMNTAPTSIIVAP